MDSVDFQAYSLARRDDAAKQEFWSCLALRETPGIGMRRIAALLSHFGSAYDAVRNVDSWGDAGLSGKEAASFRREAWRRQARQEWDAAKNSPYGIMLWSDGAYPAWLRSIADPPPFLYFSGNLAQLNGLAVAMVGMRSCSEEGLRATVHIARGLAEAGVTIVSGMAKGIDRAAHLAGLEGPGGSIGVLGAGIDVLYPRANGDLYALMREKGVLVSEYPPGYGAEARNFPIRNRIISGLARAVVVVEAAVRSGSLNTAKHALEQNRELMAVPGAVSASSAKGCQELIRKGAKPVFCADDVLRELVPLLADHVRQGMLARDLARFQYPRAEREGARDGIAERLPDSFLPWRNPEPPGGGSKQTGKGARRTPVPHSGGPACPSDADPPVLGGIDALVYGAICNGPVHIDDICRALGQNAGDISRVTAILEIRGLVERLPGMRYTVR